MVNANSGPTYAFNVTSDKALTFGAKSNAYYVQIAVVTITSPAGVVIARTTFKGSGEGVTMKNQAGAESWRYRVAASPSSQWKVTLTFYHGNPGDDWSFVPSQATASINDCVGSAKSEDAPNKREWIDWNDTIITVS
jgi:hypothetical protein